MFNFCNQFNVAVNSDIKVNDLYNTIQSAVIIIHINYRFILTVVMQESDDYVHVSTFNFNICNSDLMQDYDDIKMCNDADVVQNSCSISEINHIISENLIDISSENDLAQCINQFNINNVFAFYKAARIYNSDFIDLFKNLEAEIITHCYSSDIVNCLTEWILTSHTCILDE